MSSWGMTKIALVGLQSFVRLAAIVLMVVGPPRAGVAAAGVGVAEYG